MILQDECLQEQTLILMNHSLPSAPHSVTLSSLFWYFTGYSMIIAIIMKKQLPDPFYNVRVVNYLLGTMLFGTQQKEQTE